MDVTNPTPEWLSRMYRRIALDPVREGRWFESVIERWGMSENQLAMQLGKPRAYVSQRRALARGSRAVHVALRYGVITFSQARGICTVVTDRNRQRRLLHIVIRRLRAGEQLTEQQCRNLALETGKGEALGPGRA